MTARDKTMRMQKSNSPAFVAVILGVLLFSATVSAQEKPDFGVVRHFIDTVTDRVPSLTAFPSYPSIARRDRIEGEATVCFKIRTNGRISRPIVTDYSHKIFS